MTVSAVYIPKKRPGPPAAGPLCRLEFGWSRLLYTASSGILIFRGALKGSQVLLALVSCFDWAVRSTYRTAWAVQPCCRCSYSYGNGPAVGPQVSGNWEFLRGFWRAVAPLMAPWCADGEMPTCANLNLYGGSGSRVRWHSDNEGLLGKQGESKLIVSMSFGVSALFKWKPGPRLDSDASSSWLHHGDLLVVDGCCQDEYLHCTDPLQGRERVNITFRWIRNHVPRCPLAAGVVCCLPTCAKGSLFLPGLLSIVLLAFLGLGFFLLVALLSPWLELRCLMLRFLNVGGFLTHGDYVRDTDADFVAVVEHRLVPARARSEGKRLLLAGLEGRHVGHAGVGVVSLRGAPISLPTFATVGLSEFFHLGCHLPISGGRIVHLVVVYGFQEPRLILSLVQVSLISLLGYDLYYVVQHKRVSAGGLDVWA